MFILLVFLVVQESFLGDNSYFSVFFFFGCRLDVGEGTDLDLNECPRSKLKQQCIRYLGPVCAIFSLMSILFYMFGRFLI